jgi:hypothetical protein
MTIAVMAATVLLKPKQYNIQSNAHKCLATRLPASPFLIYPIRERKKETSSLSGEIHLTVVVNPQSKP